MIKNLEDLKRVYDKHKELAEFREGRIQYTAKKEILVCGGTGCTSSKSLVLVETLNQWIEKYDLSDRVSAHITGCFGFCEKGPIIKVFPDDVGFPCGITRFWRHVLPQRECCSTSLHCWCLTSSPSRWKPTSSN